MAAAEGESAATYDALLTIGLLWLDRARHRRLRQPIGGLRLFFPEGCGVVIAHRLKAVSSSTNVELYEYAPATLRMRRVDPRHSGNVKSWLVPRREFESALGDAQEAIAPVLRIDPAAITAELIPGTSEIALRFRGLRFARWERAGVFFGIDSEQALTAATRPQLERLLHKLEAHRSPLAASRQHSSYRAQAERWLESQVIADVTPIDARIDARFVYAQVPAISAGDRGIMDGRLLAAGPLSPGTGGLPSLRLLPRDGRKPGTASASAGGAFASISSGG